MPASFSDRVVETYIAAADLSARQFYAVKLTATNTVNLGAAVADECIGVLQNKPKAGEAAEVVIHGGTLLLTDGTTAIAAGDHIGTSSGGKGIKCTTADRPCFARAEGASTADGTIINAWVYPHVFRTPA